MSEPAVPPRVRASDAEREQVAEQVRGAVGDGRLTIVEGDERLRGVYGAVHRDELVPFTADLAPAETSGTSAATPAGASGPPVPATTGPVVAVRPTSIAVVSGVNRRGVWAPGPTHSVVCMMGGAELTFASAQLDPAGLSLDVVAVMGGAKIDLRGAPIGPAGVTVRVVAIMGGAEIVVDDDTQVAETGIGLMGAFVDESGPARSPGPTVRVTGFAFMGGVAVKRAPREIERR